MLVVTARMVAGRNPVSTAHSEVPEAGFRWPVLVAGLIVGVMTGFSGVAGGFLIVPTLVMVLGFPMHMSVGTSLLIIAINSTAGIAAQLQNADINWQLALLFIVGGLVGAMLGGRLAGRIYEVEPSRGFAVLVTLDGVSRRAQRDARPMTVTFMGYLSAQPNLLPARNEGAST